jgi:hypothetical protein
LESAAANLLVRYVPRKQKDRGFGGLCRAKPGNRIGMSCPAAHERDTALTRQSAPRICHVDSRRFVTYVNEPDITADRSVEDRHDVVAGKCESCPQAGSMEGSNNQVGARTFPGHVA